MLTTLNVNIEYIYVFLNNLSKTASYFLTSCQYYIFSLILHFNLLILYTHQNFKKILKIILEYYGNKHSIILWEYYEKTPYNIMGIIIWNSSYNIIGITKP